MHDLDPATRRLATLVERVDDSQLEARTPCPGYTVADLLDHIGGLAVAFASAARKEEGTNASPPPPGDRAHLQGDWRTHIPRDLTVLGEVWRDPAAWEGTTKIAGAEMPAAVVGAVGLNEVVTHAWDLARAIGQPFDADHDSIEGCLAFVEPMSQPGAEASRAPAFGPALTPPDGASPLERLIALTGRDPAWTP
jgi:uncharacterized protein (TIGR03086 family)